ncbi:MAG: M14 family metallopeptidase [Symbiobacteriaceae bacterium]|nr:M14 family metallopeptidase [Symbiobacteriaceae bacterium]
MSPLTSPLTFFGHNMGEDRKIASWEKVVAYFHLLATESDCLQVQDMGPTTEGLPFLLVTISSASNLANLENLRQISLKTGDPRGLSAPEKEALITEGKVVAVQSMSLHANEIGGTQMAPELAYDLLSSTSEEAQRILREVVFLMVPSFNPDGLNMVVDWYGRHLGSELEGGPMPWLYHKYAGHDNNRDAFPQNLVESRYMGKIMFQDWQPQVYQDHHHMASNGARFYIAPYANPIHPNPDPLNWIEAAMYGAHMSLRLDEAGKKGVLGGAQFPGWGHMGYHRLTLHHNIVGMLTESASARMATPLYIAPDQLSSPQDKQFADYAQQASFVNPWQGGWWRLRDIVEQQKIASWALLDCAARNRDTILRTALVKAERQVSKGEQEAPYAFVIPAEQHDPLTMRKLIQLFLQQGFEVQQAKEDFRVGKQYFTAGSYLLSLAQPKRAAILSVLGRTIFPRNYWTTKRNGDPWVYDAATDTFAEYMGVDVVALDEPIPEELIRQVVSTLPPLESSLTVNSGAQGYIWTANANDSYILANRLLQEGVAVWRCAEGMVSGSGTAFPAGSFLVLGDEANRLKLKAEGLGLSLEAVTEAVDHQLLCQIQPPKIGVYHRYLGGNMEEAWTRLVLENFEFAYTSVKTEDLLRGDLRSKYDVLLFPADRLEMMQEVNRPGDNTAAAIRRMASTLPSAYTKRMGSGELQAVREFVQAGGKIVAFGSACGFVINLLELGVQNVVGGVPAKEFLTNGSTLWLEIDGASPLTWGMPERTLALNWDCPAFAITDNRKAEQYKILARYPQSNILQSGLLIGEEKIAGKGAVVQVPYGEGEAILLGLSVQKRAQTHGTFKLLFNSLYMLQ